MAFEKLQALGKDKFTRIINDLMRGKPAMQVARMVQQDWGDYQDVAEKTLTQMMNRLKIAATEGMFGEQAKELVKADGTVDIKMLKSSSLDVLGELVALATVQRTRVQTLWEKERELKMPLTGLNAIVNDFKDLLLSIQKVQFDLGVNEFKGVIPGQKTTTEAVMRPDGSMGVRTTVENSVGVLQEVFEKRRIPAQVSNGAPA